MRLAPNYRVFGHVLRLRVRATYSEIDTFAHRNRAQILARAEFSAPRRRGFGAKGDPSAWAARAGPLARSVRTATRFLNADRQPRHDGARLPTLLFQGQNRGEAGDRVDRRRANAAFLQAVHAAEKVARYRHAQLSAIKLAGDLNAKGTDSDQREFAKLTFN